MGCLHCLGCLHCPNCLQEVHPFLGARNDVFRGKTQSRASRWAGSTSVRTLAAAVPNHIPTCRAGYYPFVSEFFSIFCNFFNLHCNNSRCSKDFLCACFSRAEVTTKHSFEQSLAVLAQLQAADCEISFELSLAPLIVKKSEHNLIECRAAAALSKDSRRLFGVFHSSPCEMVSALGCFSFSVFCLCLSML